MSNVKVYRIWSEWDIGHEDVVFTSEELAREWAEKNKHLRRILKDEEASNIEELEEAGLLAFVSLKLIDGVQ
jgi:hypothetical protein